MIKTTTRILIIMIQIRIKNNHETHSIYKVVHSKGRTAKCKECCKVIGKNDLRIGKSVPFKSMHILIYFHVNSAFISFQRAKIASSVISDISKLDGVQELNHQEKALIVQYIENENKRRSKPLPEKRVRRKKSQMQIPAKTRQTRVAPSSLPSINVMFTNADQLTSGKKS